MNLKSWICTLLLAAVAAAPAFARTNDDVKAKSSPSAAAANLTEAAAVPADTKDAKDTKDVKASASPTPDLNAKVAALLDVLVKKGALAPAEANEILNAAPEAEFQLLMEALSRKGLLNAADLSAVASATTAPRTTVAATVAVSNVAPTSPSTADATESSLAAGAPAPAGSLLQAKATAPTVIPAIAPVRASPIDPPVKDGLVAAFKLGAVKMTPYGFIKATAVHDSSSPNGDDFPFVGLFLSSTSI